MKRIRLQDIAESVGCSTAVVSHVLNGSAGNIACRPALRERILRRAAESGYAPHWAGRALKRRRASALAVFLPDDGAAPFPSYDPYAAHVLDGVRRVARARGVELVLPAPVPAGGPAAAVAAALASGRADAAVLLRVPEGAPWTADLAASGAAAVAVNFFGAAPLDAVNFDGRAAAFLAASELARLGHRRLGYLGALRPGAGVGARRRLEGFLGALAERRLAVDPRWVLEEAYPEGPPLGVGRRSPVEIARWAAQLFAAAPPQTRPTAFACHSDFAAALLLGELQRLGVFCPRDVSLVGIDDDPLATMLRPTLSTIRQPLSDMGAMAAERALDLAAAAAPPAVPDDVPTGPLATAAARRGRRGRPPAAAQAALAAEADARLAHDAAARRAAAPPRERWLRYAKPAFVPRESSLPPRGSGAVFGP